MLSNQEKLLEFQKSIDRQLKGQIEKIDSEVTQYKEAQKQKLQEEASADCERLVQKQAAKIRLDYTTKHSRRYSELKKQMLLRRDEYVTKVFGEVRERLLSFTGSADYPQWLQRKLGSATEGYRFSHPRVYLREQDLGQKEKIEKLLPGCSVLPSGEITIGGFIIEDEGKSFIINESLDNTLQEQKEWFYSNSGLRLTQL